MMLHSFSSIEEEKSQQLPIEDSTVIVRLSDFLKCYVLLERCTVPPQDDDDNANSPTLVAAQIRERREELDQTPPLSVQPPEQQEYRFETPQKQEYDTRDFGMLSTYDPVYDISPLRGFYLSLWTMFPPPSSPSL
jgi:hypothetical protein